MDLTPYVDDLQRQLAVAADAGGDEARALAERLTAPLESATRLTLLNALSVAMDEVTRDLAPGSVDVRLRGLDPEFVVTPPPAPEAFEDGATHGGDSGGGHVPLPPAPAAATMPAEGDEGGTARINFRLPAPLKARVEDAAGREGLSVNAWLVRAVAAALEPATGSPRPNGRTRHRGSQGFTGWVR
ncbi:hypothetical protein [Streptomyces hesseae]|uniref:Histidine kinase n=1 Tax=Streptomyces hesseae TaxID=3075519 RepID=A0ABU2SKK8_9ACTN|nr:hypothetical protein [Streptomyces sp. DSM 40473]MDT0449516.1 hypothetical protein [Streptomyces sp. DSM 40473]